MGLTQEWQAAVSVDSQLPHTTLVMLLPFHMKLVNYYSI